MNAVRTTRNAGSTSNVRNEEGNYESQQTAHTIKGLISNSHTTRTADTNIVISLPTFA
jgi:hypothetical protein